MSLYTEKEVEFYWRSVFNDIRFQLLSPYGCDMYAYKGNVAVLGEFKKKANINSKIDLSKILTQIVRYMKKIKESKENLILPTGIIIGTDSEAVLFFAKDFYSLLDEDDVDWSKAPSSFDPNDKLFKKILKLNFVKTVITVNEKTKQSIKKFIESLENGKFLVTINNFPKVAEWISANLRIPYRLSLDFIIYNVIDPNAVKLYEKSDRIKIGNKRIKVNVNSVKRVLDLLDLSDLYNNEDELRKKFDKLRGLEERVKYGVYYTPPEIVEEAIKYIESILGEDFYDKYVVWDPAAGTGNLTIGRKFKYLVSTTIDQVEHDIKMELEVNPEAFHEVHDFLADIFDNNIRSQYKPLDTALKKGKILFYMNPPYKGPADGKRRIYERKPCSIDLMIKQSNFTLVNLSLKFLFKILYLAELCKSDEFYIASFLPVNIFGSDLSESFWERFFSCFEFIDGFLFDSRRFENVSGKWPVLFVIFKKRPKKIKNIKSCILKVELLDGKKHWFSEKISIPVFSKDCFFMKSCSICEKLRISYDSTYSNQIYSWGNRVIEVACVGSNKLGSDPVCIHNMKQAVLYSVFSSYASSRTDFHPWVGLKFFKPEIKSGLDKKDFIDKIVINSIVYLSLTSTFACFSLRNTNMPFKNRKPDKWGFRDYIQRNPDDTYNLYNHFFPFEESFVMKLYRKYSAEELIRDYKSYSEKRLVQEVVEKFKHKLYTEIKELLWFVKKCFVLYAKLGFPEAEVGDIPVRKFMGKLRDIGYKDKYEQYKKLIEKSFRKVLKEVHNAKMIK